MGVCCIVFDIDGMLVSSRFMLFPKLKCFCLFVEKHFLIPFRVLCYFQHTHFFGGNIEKCPFTYWLNGRVLFVVFVCYIYFQHLNLFLFFWKH